MRAYMMSGEGKEDVVDMDEVSREEAESKEEILDEDSDSDDDEEDDIVDEVEGDDTDN